MARWGLAVLLLISLLRMIGGGGKRRERARVGVGRDASGGTRRDCSSKTHARAMPLDLSHERASPRVKIKLAQTWIRRNSRWERAIR